MKVADFSDADQHGGFGLSTAARGGAAALISGSRHCEPAPMRLKRGAVTECTQEFVSRYRIVGR